MAEPRWPGITTRIDYLDIDGKVVFSDKVTCAEDERSLRDIKDDDRIWDVVIFGLEDEDSGEVVELGRIMRVTEV